MRRPPGGGAGPAVPVSCCLSAAGLGFLGHPAPAGELSLPHGRPTGHQVIGPQRGCRVAHEQDATGQGALFTPGTVVRSRPATTFRPAPAALLRPVPTAPLEHPIGGGHFHEASTRVHAIHPSPRARLATGPRAGNPYGFPPVFSSPAAPGWNKGGFGFYPGLRTPQLPAAHARAETGQRALARVPRLRHQPGLQRRIPLELMHPHFARSPMSPP
jgi:hypothetical protein